MEWEEEGNPRNVLPMKNVQSLDGHGDDVNAGETCSIRIREGSKMVAYTAKLLGVGKCNSVHVLCTGHGITNERYHN